MRVQNILCIWLISCNIVSTAAFGEELEVSLQTENPLASLYLLPISQNDSELPEATLKQLEQILIFDLDHNGSTAVSKRTSERNLLGQTGSLNQLGSLSAWRAEHIDYVVKAQLEGKELKAVVLDVQKQAMKNINGVTLTGNMGENRAQIHRLADTIHKALFGVDGIATTHILYTITTRNSSDSTKWISEIWEADYDGGNPRQLTNNRSMTITPVYFPAKPGRTAGGFLYVSYELGVPKIYVASLKDSKRSRLNSMKGNQLMPAISKQRDKIAFISDVAGNPDLFLQRFSPETGAIDKPYQIFAAKQSSQGSPTFNPSGDQIAFVSNKDGSPKIYVMPVPSPGTQLKDLKANLISKTNRENSAPAWSPDGTKIAYCSKGKGDRQIWVYDFQTKQETQITRSPGHKENPSWAPNSNHLVFNSSTPTGNDLFLVHLNQGEPTQITSGPGEKRFPNWEQRE